MLDYWLLSPCDNELLNAAILGNVKKELLSICARIIIEAIVFYVVSLVYCVYVLLFYFVVFSTLRLRVYSVYRLNWGGVEEKD